MKIYVENRLKEALSARYENVKMHQHPTDLLFLFDFFHNGVHFNTRVFDTLDLCAMERDFDDFFNNIVYDVENSPT
jgi:hypothetical protein